MQSTLAELASCAEHPDSDGAPSAVQQPHAEPSRQLDTLHPSVWLAHQVGHRTEAVDSSRFAGLDAELPGQGWPRRCLTELLLPHPGVGELRLLAPALTRVQARTVMFFNPPMELDASALVHLGFDLDQLLIVKTKARTLPGTDSLWSLEQALKSGHVGAVVAWLPPRLRAERLRRLQLAAHNHDGAAFMVREMAVADLPSASPLRLALRAGGVDRLRIDVVKRRGPPRLEPLLIELPSVLSAAAKRRSTAVIGVPEDARATETQTS